MFLGGGAVSSLIIFMAAGIFVGFVINTLYIFVHLTKNNIVVIFAIDLLSSLLCGLIFFSIALKYFYATINFYFILCFISGIVFEYIFIKNLVANPVKYVYNKLKEKKSHKKESL